MPRRKHPQNPPSEGDKPKSSSALRRLDAATNALAPELGLDAAHKLKDAERARLCRLRDAYLAALFAQKGDEERAECLFELEREARMCEMSAGGGARMVLDRLALAATALRTEAQSHEECRELWEACDLVGAWVRADRLLAEERQRVSEFDSFAHEVSENVGATSSVLFVLAQATSPEDAAHRALDALLAAFSWDMGSYWDVTDDGRLALSVASGLDDRSLQKQRTLRVARGMGILGSAWERGDVLVASLDESHAGELERELYASGMRTVATLPVFLNDRVVAVLAFSSREGFDLNEARKDVLRNVAILIASSLERMQKMNEVKELAANAEAVNTVLKRINVAQNATDAAQGALEAVREAFGCDFGACWVRVNGAHDLELVAQSGEPHEGFRRATREARPVRGVGVIGRTFLERDLVIVENLGALEGDPRFFAARDAGIRAGVCIPLVKQGEINGVIELWLKREVSFSPLRLDALRSVGSAVSSTLERLDERDAFARSLRDFASELMDVSSNLSATTAEQSASAQELASAIGQVTATLSELRETSLEALRNAESVISQAEVAFRTSAAGRESVVHAIESMRAIREQVGEIAERILQLNDQTSQIGSIIATVNEISAQSKLLALNAAIEAARAGEHGRGFGVVASEIRSLAEQSKEATGQVRNILGEIQASTNAAVVAAEEGTKKSESGMALADLSGAKIQELARSMEESSSSARLIANSARQQSAGIEQVAQALIAISNATNSTAQGLKQTEQAASQLLMLAERMASLVSIMVPERPLALTMSRPSNQNAAE